MDDLIICIAPCPGENQTERFPGKLDVVDEVIRSHEAGASVVHLHVRDSAGRQTTDTSLFGDQVNRIREASSVIIEGSTGGTPEHTLEERSCSLTVSGIEMGSLNMGSINMAGGVYQNPMPDILYYAETMLKQKIKPGCCIFDLSMLFNVRRLQEERLLEDPLVYNLVFDVPDTLPFSKDMLEIFLDRIPENGAWFLTRHHAPGWRGFLDALELGGHVRVGYEDGPFLSIGDRARSNADLVEEVAEGARIIGRNVAEPERARELLGIGKGLPTVRGNINET